MSTHNMFGGYMDKKSLFQLKDELFKLCQEVGNYQLDNLGSHTLTIDAKSSEVDFVTEADEESERRIVAFIKERFPLHNICAEESGHEALGSEYTWIIDPIDGTTNYAHGYPLFCIAIGLEYKGEMILGCVYLPKQAEFYWAILGEGAFLGEDNIHVSHNETLTKSILATGFPYDKATSVDNNLNYFAHMMPQLSGIRRSGSACIDQIHVAAGCIDGYFEMNLNLWDFKAASLIVREAGGQTDFRPLRGKYSVVVTNGKIHQALRNELYQVDNKDY